MKKRKWTALIFMCLLLMTHTLTALADTNANVIFDGDARKFIYLDGSENLFDNFKGIMPDETRTQKIVLTNNDHREMKFYLSADFAEEIGEGKADGAIYHVTFKNNGETYFEGILGGDSSLGKQYMGDNFLLATLKKGKTTEIEMSIFIDGESMDNSYQNTEGLLKFTFSVEYDDPEDKGTLPDQGGTDTGDQTNIAPFIIVLILCAIVLIVILIKGKKRKDHEED